MSSCRFCAGPLTTSFCDLGMSPLSNALVKPEAAHGPEKFYPLHAYVCAACFLVQLEEFESPDNIFAADYPYFSSFSDTWLAHARAYVEKATDRFGLSSKSLVMEVASNDGYLLQYFVQRGIPVLGIEPAASVARAAEEKGVETLRRFFGVELARELSASGKQADLLLGNNVLAHVPDINDFVEGIRIALAPHGTCTFEFPHLLQLIRGVQFDTIYHEHFSYLSLSTVERIFAAHELTLVDVEELPTHGGSLRIYATHAKRGVEPSAAVTALRAAERAFGLDDLETYRRFGDAVETCKRRFLRFLVDAKEQGKQVVGYGAPAKGNTLLNYCGIKRDLLAYTVDRSPHKQGCLLPGTRIPIHSPNRIRETKPDYVLVLPWNLVDEVMSQMSDVRDWGGAFVTAIPEVRVWR